MFGRKEFLWLTVTVTSLSALGACSDDDDDSAPPRGGAGGAGGANGENPGGVAGGGNSGASRAGSDAGGVSGSGVNGGSSAQSDAGGEGGTPSRDAGESMNAGGSQALGGQVGTGGMAQTAGIGGEGGSPAAAPKCDGLTMTQTATTGNGHTHITPEGESTLQFVINISQTARDFELPATDHSHELSFSLEDLETLRNGGTVTNKQSSESLSHTHTYTISCS